MPELPDVEVFRRYISVTALHKTIESVEISTSDMVTGVSAQELKRTLQGDQFVSAGRHGKYLFIQMAEGEKWLILYFGMTGFPTYFKNLAKSPPHERLLISFTNGYHLAYDCQRKLGKMGLVDAPEVLIEENVLGPDALDPGLSRARFAAALRNTRATIKSALMNQKIIAGIGNIYSDEILFQAALRPEIRSNELREDHVDRLYSHMHHVLNAAIEARADPERLPASFIIPRRHGDGSCPKCNETLMKRKIGGRTAWYCPRCQKV